MVAFCIVGYPKDVRSQMEKLKIQENAQIARICDLRSPNCEVIYVSPVVLSEDLETYNLKLLSLGQEGRHPEDLSKRLTFITPESLGKFGGHNLSLATVLLHSPKAMRRIKNLTRGKSAYIVPGVVSQDDLAVARQLGLPILGTDPNTVQLYSSKKAGAIKLFTEAKVSVVCRMCLYSMYVHALCACIRVQCFSASLLAAQPDNGGGGARCEDMYICMYVCIRDVFIHNVHKYSNNC